MIVYFIIFVIVIWIGVAYEFFSAPYSDNDNNKKDKHGNN